MAPTTLNKYMYQLLAVILCMATIKIIKRRQDTRRRRVGITWTRSWLQRRNASRTNVNLVNELQTEDPAEFKRYFRMTGMNLNYYWKRYHLWLEEIIPNLDHQFQQLKDWLWLYGFWQLVNSFVKTCSPLSYLKLVDIFSTYLKLVDFKATCNYIDEQSIINHVNNFVLVD